MEEPQLTKEENEWLTALDKEREGNKFQFEEDLLKQRTLALEIAGRLPHHTMAEVLQEADKAFEWILSKRYSTKF